jgi:hypothetical protein
MALDGHTSPARFLSRRIWLLFISFMLLLLPTPALAQDQSAVPESYRRIIFIPGVSFAYPVSENEGHFKSCDRAWRSKPENGGTFYDIAHYLQGPTKLLAVSRHVYREQDFLAFSYNDVWSIIGDPRFAGKDPVLPAAQRLLKAANCSSENDYSGVDTRVHVIASVYKLQAQIKKWRSDCPYCRFDIICHSLGGAVAVYWAAMLADEADLAYIHNIITIDSPINGISSTIANETVSKVLTDFFDSSGDAGRGLQHKPLIYQFPYLPTDSFLDDLKRDPLRVDITCIDNKYDLLVRSVDAVREKCFSYEGAYSNPIRWVEYNPLGINIPNPISDIKRINGDIAAAHGEPLHHPDVLKAIDLVLVGNRSHWTERASLRTEVLADRDARLAGLSSFPIVDPGAPVEMTITMRNAGDLPWSLDDDFLIWVNGTLFAGLKRSTITAPVVKNGQVHFTLKFDAPKEPGAYSSDWQMSYRGSPYGAHVKFTVVVLSEAQRNPGGVVAAFIGKAIADTQAQIDELVQQARDQAEQMVRREIERQIARLIQTVCGLAPTALVLASGFAWRRKVRRRRRGGDDC